MKEAPEKIYWDKAYRIADENKDYDCEISYIRADIVDELVEALEQLMSIVKIHSRATNNNFAWAEMDMARDALAKAKGEE